MCDQSVWEEFIMCVLSVWEEFIICVISQRGRSSLYV